MGGNYVNRSGHISASATDHRTLPETELWTQVILRAITDLNGHGSVTGGSVQDSAREWFASESDRVCSFNWTCQIINVDPNFIRSQLATKLRMKKSDQVMPSIAQGATGWTGKDSPLSDNLDCAEARPALKRLVA